MSHDSIGMVRSLRPVRPSATPTRLAIRKTTERSTISTSRSWFSIAASSPPTSVSSHSDTAMIMLLGPTIWKTVGISASDPRRGLIVAAVAAGTRRKNQAQIGADRPPADTAS
jgi:hypothetical protein